MADRREERREANAEAAAAKARAKASRPWYRKKRFLIPGALLILIIVIVASTSGGDDGDDSVASDDGNGGEAEAETAGIGSPARDGQFEFTVSGLECGVMSVGQEPITEQAQGQFCLLDIRVSNIGDQAQSLFADNQYLFDGEGTQYSASSSATITNSPEGQTFFSEINPGNAVEGVIVFDVPADASITTAELHDSAFSGGIEVNVGG